MTTWVVLGAMVALALALLLPSVLRRGRRVEDRDVYEAQVYRDQLSEIARERERGALDAADAEAARAEVARRLLAVEPEDAGAEDDAGPAPAGAGRLTGAATVVAAPLAALAIYLSMGSPDLPGRPAAERAAERAQPRQSAGDMVAMVNQLGEKLRARPNDREGWSLYAHALSRLGRFDEAVTAWKKTVALAPNDVDLVSQLAEAQISAANGMVTPVALASLDAALRLDPGEPRARYYRGLAALQAGDNEDGLRRWLALEADSPPNAPWRKILGNRIKRLTEEGKIDTGRLAALRAEAAKGEPREAAAPPLRPAGSAPRGPTAADVKASRSMTATDRQAMIRSMVQRLADRLKDNPDDLAGWQRLERAQRVLGQTAKADKAAARVKALQQAGTPAAAPPRPRGPTTADVAAAQSMQPADRQSMVRGMVARLAERLKTQPGDAAGWVQLGRSYKVLGDMKQARAAYAKAVALKPDDSDVLIDYLDTIIRTANPRAAMPEALASTADRLVKLRPGHPAGHWFSGVARLQADDKPGAVAHWKTLRQLLDPKGSQHRDLTERIEKLEKEIGQ